MATNTSATSAYQPVEVWFRIERHAGGFPETVARPPLTWDALPLVGLWPSFDPRQRTPADAQGVSNLPRREWEQLLAEAAGGGGDEFRILSVPFYLDNVSRGDIVNVRRVQTRAADYFEFRDVARHAGHNTYRLQLASKEALEAAMRELRAKGLGVEAAARGLLAVDVPPEADQFATDQFLLAHALAGRWELQDGHCCPLEPGEARPRGRWRRARHPELPA